MEAKCCVVVLNCMSLETVLKYFSMYLVMSLGQIYSNLFLICLLSFFPHTALVVHELTL